MKPNRQKLKVDVLLASLNSFYFETVAAKFLFRKDILQQFFQCSLSLAISITEPQFKL